MEEELSPFVQTDFSNLPKWETLLNEVANENEMGFRAQIKAVSDSRFSGANPNEVVAAVPNALVIFIADQRALERKRGFYCAANFGIARQEAPYRLPVKS